MSGVGQGTGDMEPGRWWRVTYRPEIGERRLWCETSDEQEAREAYRALKPIDRPRLQRQYVKTVTEWRDA